MAFAHLTSVEGTVIQANRIAYLSEELSEPRNGVYFVGFLIHIGRNDAPILEGRHR